MIASLEIHLHKIKLFGYHGLLPGEELMGGEFEVNVTVKYTPTNAVIKQIDETLDYTILLNMVKQRMKIPTHLLETIVTEIANEIVEKFSTITEVAVSLYKMRPPIENFEGAVGVSYTLKKN